MTRTPLRVIALLLCLFASPALAQDRGRITGLVLDQANGHGLPFATVTVVELKKGALSDSKGEFLITGIPAGTYTVQCQFLGYTPDSRTSVSVPAGGAARVEFKLKEIVVRQEKEVVVTGERPLVEVNVGTSVRTVTSKDIANLPVQTLTDVLEKQAGISKENDQLHVRGGRSDETVFIVDGVVNRNLISGQSTAGNINARSVAEVNVITGGFDAKYGQALSGVVDVKLKEGSDKYHGGFSSQGGKYGTYYLAGQTSGPDWITGGLKKLGVHIPGSATFLVDASADFSDTYLPGIEDMASPAQLRSGYEDSFFGHKFTWGQGFMPSQENTWRGLYKMTYKPSTSNKFDFNYEKRIGFDQGFTRRPFSDFTGFDISYPWAWTKRLDHYPTITEDNVTQALTWTKLWSKTDFTNFQVSHYFNNYNMSVDGRDWTTYQRPQDTSLPDSLNTFYFIDTGDYFQWADNYSDVWTLNGAYSTRKYHGHAIETGFRHDAQNVQYVTIQFPWDYSPDGLGSAHDLWHVYPAQGNLYAQDQMQYEGFAANVGVRWDYWFPGEQLEKAVADTSNHNITDATRQGFYEDTNVLFGRRYKSHISPRIQVSHPITDKDNFFFNYGQFTQFPPYFYVYSKLTSVSSESFPILGNANLNPEISVQYEVGARHTFRADMAGNVTAFWKDIYDYPTATTFKRTQGTELVDILVYRNQDYARSRGFEMEFEKRRRKFWQYKANFSYSIASGKSSDPNEAKLVEQNGGDAAETRLGEVFVFWNRPYHVSANVDFRVDWDQDPPKIFGLTMPRGWGMNVFAVGQSGRAYTPVQQLGEEAAKPYSKNAPFQVTVDLRGNKDIRIGSGQRFSLTVNATNIFNTKVPRRIDPLTGKGYEAGKGIFSPEELAKLSSESARQALIVGTLEDPSNYMPGAQWRVGLDYDF